jgi:replicative DNA helicase
LANWEIRLLSKIIESNNPDIPLIKYGIQGDHFKDIIARRVYGIILEHRNRFGGVPSAELIQEKIKEFKPVKSTDTIEALCEQVVQSNFEIEMGKLLQKVTSLADTSPKDALNSMTKGARELQSKWKFSPNDINLTDQVRPILDTYQSTKLFRGVTGLPYPWPFLSEETGGMHPQNLIVIYGSPKSCKSWVMLYMAIHLYKQCGKRVLVITKEMSSEQIAKRAVAIYAKVNYGQFSKGKLDTEEEIRVRKELEKMAIDSKEKADTPSVGKFIISDGRGAAGGAVSVSSILAKVDEYRPDIVFVDGVYLLADDRTKERTIDYKNITHITQDLKELAQIKNIPVVITTQANRGGDSASKYDDIGYSASFTRDADVVLRIFRDYKEKEIAVVIKAIREGEEKAFVINCLLAENMDVKYSDKLNMKKFLSADRLGVSELDATISAEAMNGKSKGKGKSTDNVEEKLNKIRETNFNSG